MIIKKIYDLPPGAFKVKGQTFNYIHANGQRSEPLGIPKRGCLHWTAGNRKDIYDDYHYNITEFPGTNEPVVFQSLKLSEKGQHLWGRNSEIIGLTFCCMLNPKDFPTTGMLDTMSILVAELSAWKNIDITKKQNTQAKQRKSNPDRLVNVTGSIQISGFSDHGTYAKFDQYSQERWDIGVFLYPVIERAKAYHQELKQGKRQFIFKDIIQE